MSAVCCRESAREDAFEVETPSIAGFLPVCQPLFQSSTSRPSPETTTQESNWAVTVAIFGGGRSSRRVMGGEQKKIGRIWVCVALEF